MTKSSEEIRAGLEAYRAGLTRGRDAVQALAEQTRQLVQESEQLLLALPERPVWLGAPGDEHFLEASEADFAMLLAAADDFRRWSARCSTVFQVSIAGQGEAEGVRMKLIRAYQELTRRAEDLQQLMLGRLATGDEPPQVERALTASQDVNLLIRSVWNQLRDLLAGERMADPEKSAKRSRLMNDMDLAVALLDFGEPPQAT